MQLTRTRLILLALSSISMLVAETRDPKAVEVADAVHQAMGGMDKWNNSRYVRFDFKVGKPGEWRVDRHHLWDKWEGRYRFENTDKDGKRTTVLFNVNTKEGSVYLDGEKLAGDDAAKAIDQAYGSFINDMYWLSMPWKWNDPGVNLAYEGEKEYDGKPYDVVQLTFESVGLTPGDTYHAYVSKDSHLMTHWEYKLQSDRTGSWDWEYLESNGVKLAKTHTNAEGMQINMGDVKVSDTVDETLFTDPSKPI